MDGNSGIILRDGKTHTLPWSAGYAFARAPGYAPARAVLVCEKNVQEQTNLVYHWSNGGVIHEDSRFEGSVMASRDLKDCFIAILFFNADYLNGTSDDPGLVMGLSSIGDLKSGVRTKVNVQYGYLHADKRQKFYVPLLFSEGREVRTNQALEAAFLFRRIETLQHERALAAYRQKNPTADADAKPRLRFAPVFDEGTSLDGVPAVIRVDYTVNEDGVVENVVPQDGLAPAVARTLVRTLSGWQYYPKLVKGIPRRTFLAAQFQLKEPAPR